MRFRPALVLVLALVLAFGACTGRPKSYPARKASHVVVISVDGMRPEFYLDKSYDAPHLRKLAAAGWAARGMTPIYPTLTYPNHAAIVTGMYADESGIVNNTRFDWEKGSTPDWYWESKSFRAATVWQRAKAAGKTTAIVSWPSSAGAAVDWLMPEVFFPFGGPYAGGPAGAKPEDWRITFDHMSPDFREEAVSAAGPSYTSFDGRDEWVTRVAIETLKSHHPGLLLTHLINLDMEQHRTGRESLDTRKALAAADERVGKIASAIHFKDTALLVVSDHGFLDYDKQIHLNTLFVARGWLHAGKDGTVSDWQAIAHPAGGAAAIYVKERGLEPQVIQVLNQNAKGLYRVLDRSALHGLHAFPDATCALEPTEGYVFAPGFTGPLVTSASGTRGQHGPLPDNQKLLAGFIAVGADVTPGTPDTTIRILDVAPTIGRLLGFDMPGAEGRVLPFVR